MDIRDTWEVGTTADTLRHCVTTEEPINKELEDTGFVSLIDKPKTYNA